MSSDLHFDVTIEIPAGARNKYEMDYTSNRIRLNRMLFTSTRYPADYGYIDNSLGRDDDPLDAMVLLQEPTFPGCVIRSRAVGMFLMRDEVGPDEKVICVMATDPRYAQVTGPGGFARLRAQRDRALLPDLQGNGTGQDGRKAPLGAPG